MPAIALALQTVCSDIKPQVYEYTKDQEVIRFLVNDCGFDPNTSFKNIWRDQAFSYDQKLTLDVPTERSVVPGYLEEQTPLSLLLTS